MTPAPSIALLFAAALLVISTPGSAQPACQQADLAGAWDLYLAGGEVDGQWGGWSACRVTISPQGVPRGPCVDDDGTITRVGGGQLTVGNACRISGRLVLVDDDDGIRIPLPVPRATLSPSGDLVGGVARIRVDGSLFSALFQMIRTAR